MHIREQLPRSRTQPHLRVIESEPVRQSIPANVNPIEWNQSLGLARQACARIFRDNGSPADAMRAFGLVPEAGLDWSRAVEMIALSFARPGTRRAA